MSPIITSKTRIPLDDEWDLYVVNKGHNAPVILSITEKRDNAPVSERISISLNRSQTVSLARSLMGIVQSLPE